ncbi:MAG: hypothetical protein K940chlam2_00164 [Chlamydiae bacterium]|nr:hypothetical protein [Chlamydiota bacterium]
MTGNITDLRGVQVFILPTVHGRAEAVRDRALELFATEGDTLLHEVGEALPKLTGVVARSWYDPAVTRVIGEACSLVGRVKMASDATLKELFASELPTDFDGDIRALVGRAVQMKLHQVCKETFAVNQAHLRRAIEESLPKKGVGRLFVSMGENHAKDSALIRLLEDSKLNFVILKP